MSTQSVGRKSLAVLIEFDAREVGVGIGFLSLPKHFPAMADQVKVGFVAWKSAWVFQDDHASIDFNYLFDLGVKRHNIHEIPA